MDGTKPQTAEQINLPQTGKVDIAVEKPKRKAPPIPDPPKKPEPIAPPAGWWKVTDLKGTREGVLKQIAAQTDIPDHAKVFLRSEVERIDPKFNLISLDVHYHDQGETLVIHFTRKASIIAL